MVKCVFLRVGELSNNGPTPKSPSDLIENTRYDPIRDETKKKKKMIASSINCLTSHAFMHHLQFWNHIYYFNINHPNLCIEIAPFFARGYI